MRMKNVTKEILRKQIYYTRNQLHSKEWQNRSTTIHNHLLQSSIWQKAAHVALYSSFQAEVDTQQLIQVGLEQQKSIYLPKSNAQNKEMRFYQIDGLHQLQPGSFGILEPQSSNASPLDPAQLELLICPGLVFDFLGNRIGYGGGFYDRFLEQHRGYSFTTCALAFHFQVMQEKLEPEPYDIAMDWIVTEQGMIHASLNRGANNL